MKKTVVYILSTDYAGSHWLSLLVGSHSRAMHLGEIKRLQKPLGKQGVVCTICEDNGPCPVMSGIGPGNLTSVYDIIFSRIGPQKDVLVDASKTIQGWVDMFLGHDAYQRKYIHLIRDPRALVRRYRVTGSVNRDIARRREIFRQRRTFGLGMAFSMDRNLVCASYWLAENRGITRFIQENHLDAITVTYEDLARDTGGELRRLMEWIGLPYEPAQLEYWNFEHHGTQKRRYDWVKEQKTQYLDLRWKEFLSEQEQAHIVHDPRIIRYLAEQQLDLQADGLTRHAKAIV